MEIKDFVTFGLSFAALVFSLLSIYFAHFHKPSGAVLSLVSRSYSPAVMSDGQMISKSKRNIQYCIGNTGRQSLYVKELCMMRGPSLAGNLKDSRSYFVLKCSRIKPFIINPGEVVPFELTHDEDYSDRLQIHDGINNYEMVSLDILSADGMRYQMCHDIGRITHSDMFVGDPVFNGVTLGKPVHSAWYV